MSLNTYKTSAGESLPKRKIDKLISDSKNRFKEEFPDKYGYYLCERCTRNDCLRWQVSHIISVDQCQKLSISELAWDESNFELLGEKCHRDIEGWSNKKRALWYKCRLKGGRFLDFLVNWQKQEMGYGS